MTTATYEMYEAFADEADHYDTGSRGPQLREMTSKQKYNTGARYRRRLTGAGGSHRRRQKQICC